MKTASNPQVQGRGARRPRSYRPKLEFLEDRLQPGSVLTTAMGWSLFASALPFLDSDALSSPNALAETLSESQSLAHRRSSEITSGEQIGFLAVAQSAQETATSAAPVQQQPANSSQQAAADWTTPWQAAAVHSQAVAASAGQTSTAKASGTSTASGPSSASAVGVAAPAPIATNSGSFKNSTVPPPQAIPGNLQSQTPGKVHQVSFKDGQHNMPQLGIVSSSHPDGSKLNVTYSTFFGGAGADSGNSIDNTDDGTSFTTGTTNVAGQDQVFVVSINTAGVCTATVNLFALNGDNLTGTGVTVDDAGGSQNDLYLTINDTGPLTPGSYVVQLDQGLTTLQNVFFSPNTTLNGIDLGETPVSSGVYVAGWQMNADGTNDTLVGQFDRLLNPVATVVIQRFDAAGNHLSSCANAIEVDTNGQAYLASTINDAPGDSIGAFSSLNIPTAVENWVDTQANPMPGKGEGLCIEVLKDDPQGSVYLGGRVFNPASPGPYKSDGLIARVNAVTGLPIFGPFVYSYGNMGDYYLKGLEVDPMLNPYATGPAWFAGFGYFPHLSKFDISGNPITNFYTWAAGNPAVPSYGNSLEIGTTDFQGQGPDLYVTGLTADATFGPIVAACQPIYGGGPSDAFITAGHQPI